MKVFKNGIENVHFIKNNTESVLSIVKIFDLTGKLVLTKSIENNDSNPSVNIAALYSGLYMIAVEDSTGNLYQSKLIVE